MAGFIKTVLALAAPRAPAQPPLREAQPARSTSPSSPFYVNAALRAVDGAAGAPAARGRQRVRRGRHQRARHPGGGAAAPARRRAVARGGSCWRCSARDARPRWSGTTDEPGAAPARAPRRCRWRTWPTRCRSGRKALRAPPRAGVPRRAQDAAGGAGGARARSGVTGAVQTEAGRLGGVHVPGRRRAVRGHGRASCTQPSRSIRERGGRAARELLAPHAGLRPARGCCSPPPAERGGRDRQLEQTVAHPARALRHRVRAGEAAGCPGACSPARDDRPQRGRVRGGLPRRRVLAGGRACALVALRGRLFETLPAGAMLSVPLPEAELRALLGSELSICRRQRARPVRGRRGRREAIDALEAQLARARGGVHAPAHRRGGALRDAGADPRASSSAFCRTVPLRGAEAARTSPT